MSVLTFSLPQTVPTNSTSRMLPLTESRANILTKKEKNHRMQLTETDELHQIISGGMDEKIGGKKMKFSSKSCDIIENRTDIKITGKQTKNQPLPVAVARRNARERNRVKQVNNGFAALREHIPDEIAEAYEVQATGRNAVKKLSKVETLRMAVAYIRSLEWTLQQNQTGKELSHSLYSGSSFSPTPSTSSSILSTPPPEQNYLPFDEEQLLIPSHHPYDSSDYREVTTINGLECVRIPGTNTYQLLQRTVCDTDQLQLDLQTNEPLENIPNNLISDNYDQTYKTMEQSEFSLQSCLNMDDIHTDIKKENESCTTMKTDTDSILSQLKLPSMIHFQQGGKRYQLVMAQEADNSTIYLDTDYQRLVNLEQDAQLPILTPENSIEFLTTGGYIPLKSEILDELTDSHGHDISLSKEAESVPDQNVIGTIEWYKQN